MNTATSSGNPSPSCASLRQTFPTVFPVPVEVSPHGANGNGAAADHNGNGARRLTLTQRRLISRNMKRRWREWRKARKAGTV